MGEYRYSHWQDDQPKHRVESAPAQESRKLPDPVVNIIVIVFVFAAILLLGAGTLRWWQGWTFIASYSFFMFIAAFQLKEDPQLLARRVNVEQDAIAKKVPAVFNLFFLCFPLAALDKRFGWSAVPVPVVLVGAVVVACGCALILWVFRENSFASASVKVEESQTIITTGPYSLVRHPMYLGIILMVLFAPLALGSWWALIPATLVIPMNVMRLHGEEELLASQLPAYKEYMAQTLYKLFPGIW